MTLFPPSPFAGRLKMRGKARSLAGLAVAFWLVAAIDRAAEMVCRVSAAARKRMSKTSLRF